MKSYDEMEKNDENERREKKARWRAFSRNWVLYVFLFLTGVLSFFAGMYIGLSPDANGTINFASGWDIVRRVFFAVYFSVGFVLTAEGAALFWEMKLVYHDVDKNGASSKNQINTARIALGVSILTVVITGLSAAHFIAQWVGTLVNFASVPDAAQAWVVWSIPILLVFHTVSAIIYWYNSEEARLSRYRNAIILQTQAELSEIEASAFVDEYKKVAPELARARGKMRAEQAARDDFYHREVQTGRDLDGDGHIGKPSNNRSLRPAYNNDTGNFTQPSSQK